MSRNNIRGGRNGAGPNSSKTSDAPTVPTTLISLETLLYVGFSEDFANGL